MTDKPKTPHPGLDPHVPAALQPAVPPKMKRGFDPAAAKVPQGKGFGAAGKSVSKRMTIPGKGRSR